MTLPGGLPSPPSPRGGSPTHAAAPTGPDVTLTLTLVTEPAHLADSLALGLQYDQSITMNLTAVMSEVIARYITMLEETPCRVLITDLKARLP